MTTPALALIGAIDALVQERVDAWAAKHVCSGDANRLLTVQAACSRAGISRSTLYAWIKDGLPTLQLPGAESGATTQRIRVADFDAWVAARCGRKQDDAPGLRSLVKARQTRLGAQKRKVVG